MRRKRAEEGGSIDVVTTTDKTPSGCSRLTRATMAPFPFNTRFYIEKRETDFLKQLHERMGCFHCKSKGGKYKGCGGCKISQYCDSTCQKAAWKKHKKTCKLAAHNRAQPEMHGPVVRLLREDGTVKEDEFDREMELYSQMFVKELAGWFDAGGNESKYGFRQRIIRLLVCCVEDMDNIVRLIGTAQFHIPSHDYGFGENGAFDEGNTVNYDFHHAIYRKIDQGQAAVNKIYPRDGGFGSVAENKKELVIECIGEFMDKLKSEDISVTFLTCGRGVAWLQDDERLKKRCGVRLGAVFAG